MIQIPGSQADNSEAVDFVSEILNPSARPEELPAQAPELTPDGIELTDDPVQVAGLASGLKGVVGKIGGAMRRATTATEDASKVAPPASAPPQPPKAPPPTPEPPKAKTLEEIKQGVMDRQVPAVTEDEARGALGAMDQPAAQPVEPGRTPARNFRSDKLQTTDDIKRLIDERAAAAGGNLDARRGVVSNDQTRVESAEYGVEDLIGRKPGQAWNAAQLTAGRDILLELGGRIMKAAEHVKGANATPADMLEFRQLLARHDAVQKQLQGAVAEAGRALQIMRTPAVPAGRLRSRQILETLDQFGGEDGARKMAELILDTGGNPAKLAQVTRKGALARTNDAITEVWINGLLSGPKTHMVNIVSNSLTALMQAPERFVAGVGRKGAQAVFGAGEGVEPGEAGAMLYGALAGFKDGLRAMARTLKTGEPSDPLAKIENQQRKAVTAANFGLDEQSPMGRAVDLVGEYYVRMPGRALAAEDELFKAIGYRQELHAQAYRQAVREGLSGPDFNRRLAELVNDPPEGMHMAAEDAARYNTFTRDLQGENWLSALGQSGQKIASLPLGRFVLPFVRTPTRIAEYTLERTPLAPTLRSFREDVASGGARRDLALARMGLGSTVSALVAAEAASGRITGGGPADRRVRATMEASGWKPYSILIDGQYVQYNRLDPMGAIVGAAADAVDIIKYSTDDQENEAVAGAVVMGFANTLANKTYLQGLSTLLDTIGDPDNEKKVTSWMAGQAASFNPAWVNFLRQTGDDAVREPVRGKDALEMTIQMMKARTPGLSDEVPPKLDVWGEPVMMETGPLSPVMVSTAKQDPAAQELIRNRIGIDRPRNVVSVELGAGTSVAVDLNAIDKTGWLYHDYRQAVGRLAKQAVEALIASDGWDSLPEGPEGERGRMIRDAFTDARRDALAELLEAHPEIEESAMLELENPKTKGTIPVPLHMR